MLAYIAWQQIFRGTERRNVGKRLCPLDTKVKISGRLALECLSSCNCRAFLCSTNVKETKMSTVFIQMFAICIYVSIFYGFLIICNLTIGVSLRSMAHCVIRFTIAMQPTDSDAFSFVLCVRKSYTKISLS